MLPSSGDSSKENCAPQDGIVEKEGPNKPFKKKNVKQRNATPQGAGSETSSNAEDKQEEAPILTNAPKDIISMQIQETKAFLSEYEEFVDTDYPKTTFTHVPRKFLSVSPFTPIEADAEGEFLPDADSKCVICHEEKDKTGKSDLITCHGYINGEMDDGKRLLGNIPMFPCRSKFHASCMINYNSGGFHFQYAARLECQARLLCPLHCCNSCNLDHHKQSAYVGDIAECALCLRAFHLTSCYPSGGRDLNVSITIGGKVEKFEMIICPAHYLPGADVQFYNKHKKRKNAVTVVPKADVTMKSHIKACCVIGCEKSSNSKTIMCKTCCRSFHSGCREVETLNGKPIPDDQCESCVCGDPIPQNTLILAKWTDNSFWLALTLDWYKYPTGNRGNINFERLGYTVVQWLIPQENDKEKQPLMSIVPVSDIARLTKNYFSLAKNSTLRNLWEEKYEEQADTALKRCPYVCKTVFGRLRTSVYYKCEPKLEEYHNNEVCNCEGADRCTKLSCQYLADDYECPPSCSKKGVCHNRQVSMGIVSEKIKLAATLCKGYGVFAKGQIEKDEYICEYVGEIIDKAEKKRRLDSVSISRDFQANHYMMELHKGLTVDAARYGNISRYINHSCDPNAASFVTKVFVKKTKEGSLYDTRSYIRAIRTIDDGDEITFSYNMNNEENLPDCECGAENCMGTMGKAKREKPEVADSSEKAAKKNKSSKKKSVKNQNRKSQEAGKNGTASKKSEISPSKPSTSSASSTSFVQQASWPISQNKKNLKKNSNQPVADTGSTLSTSTELNFHEKPQELLSPVSSRSRAASSSTPRAQKSKSRRDDVESEAPPVKRATPSLQTIQETGKAIEFPATKSAITKARALSTQSVPSPHTVEVKVRAISTRGRVQKETKRFEPI